MEEEEQRLLNNLDGSGGKAEQGGGTTERWRGGTRTWRKKSEILI